MRLREYFFPTLREDPAEAEIPSHRLLLRGGFVRQVAAGVYTFMPLGRRVLAKVEAIVREEMDRQGSLEILMPALHPRDLWERAGRWQEYGPLMFRLKDRAGREYCLAPTHEELVTATVAAEISSYRQLPLILYQIQTKFRDELRPRFGLLRAREFIMKDAYSFDRDEEGLKESYSRMVEAYTRIFRRCGLEFRMVEAVAGEIGGDVNHEFMALAEAGEDIFVSCPSCGYAANVEAATTAEPHDVGPGSQRLEEVPTPGVFRVEEVASLLDVPTSQVLKCMLYAAEGGPVAVLVPGDREVVEAKLARALGPVRLLGEADFEAEPNLVPGFAGPVGLEGVRVLADRWVRAGRDWVTGANRPGFHLRGANLGRDFQVDGWVDVAGVKEGDPCPRCSSPLGLQKAIEVGHVFQLGTRYSEPFRATFTDERGEERPVVMGCYGIGVSRILTAVVEQHRDERGIVWPPALAPFHVVVLPLNLRDPAVAAASERVYAELGREGLEVALDDRDASAGVKFADADLVGFPVQVILGRKVAEGRAEVKIRATGERLDVSLGEVGWAVRRSLAACGLALTLGQPAGEGEGALLH